MAIISFSALVNKISGKLSGTIFSSTKGITYLKKHNPSPTDHRSIKQVEIRQQISDLSGEYYSLSDTQKELWESYACMLPNPLSGINAFVSLNQKLIYYFDPTKKTNSPPLTPGTPQHLIGLTISPFGPSDFSVSWTSPSFSTLTVIINYRPGIGIERTTSQQWKFGGTEAASSLSKLIDTDYDAGRILKFKCRTIDLSGRLSPWSHAFPETSLLAGRYGYPAYGYAYYNS